MKFVALAERSKAVLLPVTEATFDASVFFFYHIYPFHSSLIKVGWDDDEYYFKINAHTQS